MGILGFDFMVLLGGKQRLLGCGVDGYRRKSLVSPCGKTLTGPSNVEPTTPWAGSDSTQTPVNSLETATQLRANFPQMKTGKKQTKDFASYSSF